MLNREFCHSPIQLDLGFLNMEQLPFVSLSQLRSLIGQTWSDKYDSSIIDDLCIFLVDGIARQAAHPIKHMKLPDLEVLIYWDTWGLTIKNGRWVSMGLYSWDSNPSNQVEQFDLQSTNDQAFLIHKIRDNLSIIAAYRSWIAGALRKWAEENNNPLANLIAHDSALTIKLADTLSICVDEKKAFSSILGSYLACNGDKKEICGIAYLLPRRVEGSRLLLSAIRLSFVCSRGEYNMAPFYAKLVQCLSATGEDLSGIGSGKELMTRFGLSQNARNRLFRLAVDEIATLCFHFPASKEHALYYLGEINRTLQRMYLSCQQYSEHGRPWLTWEVANIISKLTLLRCQGKQQNNLDENQFRMLISSINNSANEYAWAGIHADLNDQARLIPIASVVQFLEAYLDELLMPPKLLTQRAIDEDTERDLLGGNLEWYLEYNKVDIEDIPPFTATTISDKLPLISMTSDWFIATIPSLTRQQVKLGWRYLEKRALEWHQHPRWKDSRALEYTEWLCPIKTQYAEWQASLPDDLEYKLIPLTNSDELLDESITMEHCVVTYNDQCAAGFSRIFSIRDISTDKRIATAELTKDEGKWELAQLKGLNNVEMMHHIYGSPKDPIAILLNMAINWYNECNISAGMD